MQETAARQALFVVESIRRVTGKVILNKALHCLTLEKGPIEMIEEKTGLTNGRASNHRELMEAPSHVYFVYSAGRVKIGYSSNWLARVDAVCQGCPHQAEVVLVMPGDRQTERGYHVLFADSHETGEWFRLDGNVRLFLDRYASPEGREILDFAHRNFLEDAGSDVQVVGAE